ncbi:hypothetical protein FOQG_14168 [Fusarium oxysporum f. sp. raphani 54005]|uniref:Uncharacterized protein n=3 Tax=Fusarium oxysporum TaxID=5507 RepID=X0BSG1_FUSOX|nr:hypothetical protein FOVG_04818 [Fusarium oxysporum f. sp. pisi HDV247]EXK81424.1 hypothetical protein FOQG_14168 [Fusarium oxysporum f. sp. raphani 54005]EXM25335.1 hypothetical protein FOTG_07807 [Fusarium oxysporum f. sp. vasinfectum 25433]
MFDKGELNYSAIEMEARKVCCGRDEGGQKMEGCQSWP